MRVVTPIAAVLLAGALAVAAPAGARTLPGPRARLLVCQQAPAQGDRFMTVQGAMRTRKGAARMGIRFDLLQRRAGLSPAALPAPGLGVWNVSNVDRTAYRYTKRIENLAAPASYRVVVRFRWYNAKGAVIARARRFTHTCRQPDYRPELRLRNPAADATGQAGSLQYAVGVLNTGRTVAANFDVALTIEGVRRGIQTLEQLLPGARQRITFTAPRCRPGDLVTFTVDPDGRVDEADETDNQVSFPCPAV